MNALTLLATAGTILDLLGIITVIFVERKNPSSTIAWVLVLIFLPFIGFVAYAMFGSGFHIKKKKRYADKSFSDIRHRQAIAMHVPACAEIPEQATSPHSRMMTYLEEGGAHCLTADNSAEVFINGRELFARMKEDMRKAKKHIHLLYYIFRNDALGREIMGILTQKAQQGVDVRVIYDSLGSMLSGERMFKKLKAAGGRVEAFSPLAFSISSHLRLNYRNHRKITVVDGRIGYVGGMNIGEEYRGSNSRLSPWRDTHLRLTGSSVSFLEERFLLDWFSVCDTPITPEQVREFVTLSPGAGNLAVQIVSSGPDSSTSTIKSGLLEMIYAARESVFIQTPYFIPDDSFLDALRIAAGSGVDVRIMLPGKSDNALAHAATCGYARQVLESGVQVCMYDGFLHAKTIVSDGKVASIGTANADCRSFSLNFEINAFIYDEDFAARYETIFLDDSKNCLDLDDDWFTRHSPVTRAMYSVTRLLAPLM